MKRRSATLQLCRLEKNEVIVNIKSVKVSDKVMVYTQFTENEFKVKDIPELMRNHPCKKMVTLKNKDVVLELVVE
jgi:hypothetical protein